MAKWFLSLENFKSIRQLERLEGRPITLLLGPNNAGKTSVLQALLLLKGSLAYPEAVLSFRNDLVDMGSFGGTVTQGHEEEGISIKLGEEENNKAWSFFLRVDTLEGTLQIRGCDIVSEGSRFEYLRPPSSEEPSAMYSDPQEAIWKSREILKGLRWRSFIPEILLDSFPFERIAGLREPQKFIESLQYIGPLRVYPERSYRSQPPPGLDVGIDGRWAPHLLRGATKEQLVDLRHWLGAEGFGLVTNLRARDVEGLPNFVVEVNVQGQWVNLRDVGFGMSQLLPIVVESILVPATQSQEPLLLLEQPEIHLHPRAQADLGTFIAEMSRKGRRYLIETHSEYLLMRLATEVRRGKLLPDDIAIYFLSLDEKGHTQFRHIPLEKDGRLPPPEEWPEGFFDTDIKEADAFLFASLEQAGE